MASTQLLNRRVRSVKNARQITKAMEMVAASKLRRMGQAVEHSRSYNDIAASIVRKLANTVEAKHHPYFRPAEAARKLYIIFTSDRGLAGAFNTNIINESLTAFNEDRKQGVEPVVVIFGRKGAKFFSRIKNAPMLGEYEDIADTPDMNVFAPVMETIDSGITEGDFSSVNIIYTEFNSTLNQRVRRLQALPIDLQEPEEKTEKIQKADKIVYELEPTVEAVLEKALRLYLESLLIRVRVEAAASEYAMRMIAMNNANRNAGELIEDLTLELNATRQAAITQEIAEITGGVTAIEQG